MSRNKKNNQSKENEGLEIRVYNNKVVEARLEGDSVTYAFEKYLESVMGINMTKLIRPYYSHAYLAKSYIGRAFVNTDMGDVFNLEYGKKLAIKRCMTLYHQDFDKKIIELLEDLHTVEARIFNKLRKANHLELFNKAKSMDEIYDTQFRMPGQKSFGEVLETLQNE